MRGRLLALSLGLIACFVVGLAAQTQAPIGPGPGISNPTLVREEKPRYTPDAQRAKIQGIVEVEAVVAADGTVSTVSIHKSLDKVFGLDDEALRTAKAFLFKPAMKDGKPVAFKVIIQLEFRAYGRDLAADDEFARVASAPGRDITNPTLVRDQKPKYTSTALREKIQGVAEVEAVILTDGTVGAARIHKSLDAAHGLDQEAMAAAKLFLFKPAMKGGQAIALRVVIQLEFKLPG